MKSDKFTLVGVPIPLDYKADTRLIALVEKWDRSDDVESYYAASDCPRLGRDKIVQYAKYRLPHPAHILFIDADVIPRSNTLKKLLDNDKDIIAGVCPIMQRDELFWNVTKTKPEKFFDAMKTLPDNPFKAESYGFGIVLVRFEVFEKLQWPYWEDHYKPGVRTRGEDVDFCDKAKAAGFDLWVDPKVKCDHFRVTPLLQLKLKEEIKET